MSGWTDDEKAAWEAEQHEMYYTEERAAEGDEAAIAIVSAMKAVKARDNFMEGWRRPLYVWAPEGDRVHLTNPSTQFKDNYTTVPLMHLARLHPTDWFLSRTGTPEEWCATGIEPTPASLLAQRGVTPAQAAAVAADVDANASLYLYSTHDQVCSYMWHIARSAQGLDSTARVNLQHLTDEWETYDTEHANPVEGWVPYTPLDEATRGGWEMLAAFAR